MNSTYDALVIGGGPGGATAAQMLARAGWAVALLERKAFPRRKVCGEYLSATNLPLLKSLGVSEAFYERAGPDVRQVGLFAGRTMARAALPTVAGIRHAWGRALGREHLDALLLEQANRAGVDVIQPESVIDLRQEGERFACLTKRGMELRARVIVAAHGSWETGALPTQTRRETSRPSDLFAFKAHFRECDLPAGLMPLLAFPGGYGGMVHCDAGRVSLSCCVRRDVLQRIRVSGSQEAGEVVFDHIKNSCRGVHLALDSAVRDGPWLSAGPIRPGMRLSSGVIGVIPVGNAAGEAHPAIAEGITMAIQSAWLLSRRLVEWRKAGPARTGLARVAGDYAAAWRSCFASRLHASQVIAHWAMRPTAVSGVAPLFDAFPLLLTWAARWSGKIRRFDKP